MQIFLSGGTHGDWQDRVQKALGSEELVYFDPRSVRHLPMRQIAAEERAWLDRCECLLFYFEAGNPSGIGSAFEVGYCIAKGIPVIYVDEKRTSHSEWLGCHCNVVVHTLEEGIEHLEQFVRLRKLPVTP